MLTYFFTKKKIYNFLFFKLTIFYFYIYRIKKKIINLKDMTNSEVSYFLLTFIGSKSS
jgi:hypothetical protein